MGGDTPKTPEQLEQEVTSLSLKLEAEARKNVSLATELADTKTALALSEQGKSQAETDLLKAKQELQVAEQTVIDLKTLLAEAPAESESLPTIKIDKVTYELTEPQGFNYKGEIVTLEVLKTNTKLAAELVKEGVSFLRKVK